ncbi:MAG TPA: GNAT family N-acetyltransferase [Pyrinomonadaceae bacterium]
MATADDAQAISQLASEFHAYLNTIGDQTNFYFNADTYRRDGFGDNPAFIGLVAESNDEVIGYLLFHFGYDTDHSRRLAYVIDLYVNEKSRGQGVGKALMQHAADAARAHGAKALWWGVYESNDSAMRFYEGLGAKNVKGVRFMSINVEKLTS